MATKTPDERRRRKIERAIARQRKKPAPATAKREPKWKRRKLTVKRLEKIVQVPGRYGDEHPGLHLQVRSPTNCNWLLRYYRDGRERWLGLGSLKIVDRDEAALKAK